VSSNEIVGVARNNYIEAVKVVECYYLCNVLMGPLFVHSLWRVERNLVGITTYYSTRIRFGTFRAPSRLMKAD
jgi:hypothetical protein